MKIFKYANKYIVSIIFVLVLTYAQVMADLSLPDYMSKIIDTGIVSGDVDFILRVGFEMILVALFSIICSIIIGYIAARVAAKIARDIRGDVFEHITEFSSFEFNQMGSSSLITRTTNDVNQIQIFVVMLLRMIISAPIMGIGGIIKALDKCNSMTYIIVLAVSILLTVIVSLIFIVVPKFNLIQKLVDKLNLVTKESLSGMLVIRSFNKESSEEKKFSDANAELTKTNLFVNRTMTVLFPILNLVLSLTVLLIMWVGASKIGSGEIALGNVMAFIQYTMRTIMSFLMLSMVFVFLPRASVSAKRILEVLDTKQSIKNKENIKQLNKIKGIVEFRNVSFRYPDADGDVIKNINFTCYPGETTAFIGSTGSGKSTLINLIPRFFDVTEGAILIDGLDIRDMDIKNLRDNVSYVPQKGVLFSGTIESNIKYGKESASKKEVSDAAEVAQSIDFINEKEEKFSSPIASGGINVSGGQKQRLSIARALIKDAKIFIFDDSFSALDFKTDAALRKALANKTKDKNILIVAQRIGTIKNADRIVVLESGSVVGIGTHAELLNSCEIYREIAYSQLSKEELA